MGTAGSPSAGVRFRTLAAHEWTEDPSTIRPQKHSELARDLLYGSAEG